MNKPLGKVLLHCECCLKRKKWFAEYAKRYKETEKYKNRQKSEEFKALKKIRDKRYREKNKGRLKLYQAEYKKKHRNLFRFHEKQREYRLRKSRQDSGTFTEKEWELLKERSAHRCARCGQREPFMLQSYQFLTVDHIIPLSKEGTNKIDNIQALCIDCNNRKGNRI